MRWQKASHCGASNTCVEVANFAGSAFLRDSRQSDSPIIVLSRSDWTSFLRKVKEIG